MSKHFIAALAAIGGAIVLTYVGLLGFLFLKPAYDDYASRVPFERSAWVAAENQEVRPRRTQMIDDFLATHDLPGMTREQVTALLGEPPETEYFNGWDMVYWLGPERGLFSIDSEWLVLRFGEDARVAEYAVVTD